MPAGSPCSRSPVPWGWRVRRCANMRASKRSRRGYLTVPVRACLIRTRRTWRGGSTRAARTRWPCGARSGNGAIPGRAGRATASSPSAGRGRSDQAAPSGRGPACIAAARHGSSSAARTANGVVARPAPPQGGLRAMQPWCGPQGRAGPSLMIRMRTPQRTSPPGSRKHGAATLLPSQRSPRDWRRISRPSGLLSRSHGVAASGRPGQPIQAHRAPVALGAAQIAISVLVNAAIAVSAGSSAVFLTRRPSFAVVQRWVMGTVLAALAVRMATEVRR